MSGPSYWVVVVLVLGGLGLLAGALALWLGWPIIPVAAVAVLLGAAGLVLGVLPPGRPAPGTALERRETEPLWPYLAGPQPRFSRYDRDAALAEERRGATVAGLAMATMIVGLGAAGVGIALLAMSRGEELLSNSADRITDFTDDTPVNGDESPPPPTPTAIETATEPATATPVPATPTATEAPPARTAAPPSPTVTRAQPTPSPTPPPASSSERLQASLDGQWRITDVVEFGQDPGSVFTFNVTLRQDGTRVTGGGDGLALEGALDGNVLTLNYTRPGGSGIFIWGLLPDGTFDGDFRDHAANNGGSSTLVPIR